MQKLHICKASLLQVKTLHQRKEKAMKTLNTVLNIMGIVLDVAIAIMSIITIRHILATRKEK